MYPPVCPEMQTPALHCCVSAIRTHGELRREKLCSHFKLLQLCTVSAKPSSAAGNRYASAWTRLSDTLHKRAAGSHFLHPFLFPVLWWRVAWAVMLTCLQSLHHPSGDRSQLGTSFWGEQTLNGLTGCVRALRARVKRRWLLDENAKQPRDTQRTLGAARRAGWGCRSQATGWCKEHRLKSKWVWDIAVNSAVTETFSFRSLINKSSWCRSQVG